MATDADDPTLVQVLVLERVDRARNMAQFYVLSIETTLFEDLALVRRWGRLTLLQAKGMGGLGFAWKAMCPVFAELELTLLAGAPVTPERARQTWWRVRKEKARLRRLEAEAEAERALRRAQDPRRDMPSRMSGRYEAPLAEVQPRRAVGQPQPQPGSNLPAIVREEGADLPVDPSMIVMFQGEPLDLNIFVRPGVREPWEKPGLSAEARQHIKLTMLTLRFEHWKKDRILDLNNPVDRERKRLNALRNAQR